MSTIGSLYEEIVQNGYNTITAEIAWGVVVNVLKHFELFLLVGDFCGEYFECNKLLQMLVAG